jgi:hypothetical protein
VAEHAHLSRSAHQLVKPALWHDNGQNKIEKQIYDRFDDQSIQSLGKLNKYVAILMT